MQRIFERESRPQTASSGPRSDGSAARAGDGHLLQLLEEYAGVALLATNRRENIDPAFLRRIRYALHLPPPDAELRERIWRALLARTEHSLKDEPRLRSLAAAVALSGAQIKNAVLAALFLALQAQQPLALHHLALGAERELRKDGRAMHINSLRAFR